MRLDSVCDNSVPVLAAMLLADVATETAPLELIADILEDYRFISNSKSSLRITSKMGNENTITPYHEMRLNESPSLLRAGKTLRPAAAKAFVSQIKNLLLFLFLDKFRNNFKSRQLL